MGSKICTLTYSRDIVRVRKVVSGMSLSEIQVMMTEIVDNFMFIHLKEIYPS